MGLKPCFFFWGEGEILLKQPFGGGGCYLTLVGQVMICIYYVYITHTAPWMKHQEKRPEKHSTSNPKQLSLKLSKTQEKSFINWQTINYYKSNLIIISIARPPTFNSWRLLFLLRNMNFQRQAAVENFAGKKRSPAVKILPSQMSNVQNPWLTFH